MAITCHQVTWSIGILLLILQGCSGETPKPIQNGTTKSVVDSRIVETFGGKKVIVALQTPSHVEVYRIDSSVGKFCRRVWRMEPRKEKIAGYQIVSGPVQLDNGTTSKLRNWLLSRNSYNFEGASKCGFCPGYVARFVGKQTTVDIVVCFKCKDVAAVLPPDEHRGKALSFRPGAESLFKILNEIAFPDL